MGCAKCNKSKIVINNARIFTEESLCSIPYLMEIEDKLNCLKMRNLSINTSQVEVNAYLGFIQTMRNLNNFCLYDLTNIYNRLKDVSC